MSWLNENPDHTFCGSCGGSFAPEELLDGLCEPCDEALIEEALSEAEVSSTSLLPGVALREAEFEAELVKFEMRMEADHG